MNDNLFFVELITSAYGNECREGKTTQYGVSYQVYAAAACNAYLERMCKYTHRAKRKNQTKNVGKCHITGACPAKSFSKKKNMTAQLMEALI